MSILDSIYYLNQLHEPSAEGQVRTAWELPGPWIFLSLSLLCGVSLSFTHTHTQTHTPRYLYLVSKSQQKQDYRLICCFCLKYKRYAAGQKWHRRAYRRTQILALRLSSHNTMFATNKWCLLPSAWVQMRATKFESAAGHHSLIKRGADINTPFCIT
jgi:hypothetical protein